MSTIFTDFLPLGLLVLALVGAKPVKPLAGFYGGYLSREGSQSLRGLMALVVIFTHLAAKLHSGTLFPLFTRVGYLAVSVFFFLSGYGLQKQNMAKPGYHKGFLKKHLLGLAIPYIPAFFLYWLVNYLAGLPASPEYVYYEYITGNPIVSASWYVFCIGWFYFAFWLLMRCFGSSKVKMVLGTGVFCLVFSLLCIGLDFGGWWYNTVSVLILGVAWASWEERILKVLDRRWWLALILSGSVMVLGIVGKVPAMALLGTHWIAVWMVCLSGAGFCCCVLLVLRKMRFGNPLLSFLGSISLELYLYHNLFITLLRSQLVEIPWDSVFCLAVLACSIAFAWAMHRLNKWLLRSAHTKKERNP